MKTKTKITEEDYIKANRIASRNEEMEDATGWVGKHKVHKSMKTYSRKIKFKKILK